MSEEQDVLKLVCHRLERANIYATGLWLKFLCCDLMTRYRYCG
jgi:hypothetical protein